MSVESLQPELRRRAVTGFAWAYGALLAGKGGVFLSTVVLAHVLTPADFGLFAFALTVMAYLVQVVDLGASSALVQRADARDVRVRSLVLWVALLGAAVLTTVAWLAAPLLAHFYDDPKVVTVFRILAIQFVLLALTNPPQYALKGILDFRRSAYVELTTNVTRALCTVAAAVAGAGVWSLVGGQLGGLAAGAIVVWAMSAWRPRRGAAWDRLRPVLGFGLGVMTLNLLAEGIRNVDYLIVGANLGAAALGYYFLAFRFSDLVVGSIGQAAWDVLFPYYSRLRERGESADAQQSRLADGYLKSLRLGGLLIFPIGFGVAALSSPLVTTLYGERWAPSVGPAALIAIWAAMGSVAGMSGTVFKAIGRSGLMAANSFGYFVAIVPALWFASRWGITAVAVAHLCVQAAFVVYLAIVVNRVLAVRWSAGLAAVAPGLACALVTAAGMYVIARALEPGPALVVGTLAGAAAYLTILRLALPQDFAQVRALGRELRQRGRG